MKAGIGFCRRPLLGALAVGMLVMGTSAFGQEIFFIPIRTQTIGSPNGTIGAPVSATFNGTCWEYTADAGGFELDIDLRADGWANAMGAPTLGAIQATVIPAGYDNGLGSILVPKGWVNLGDGDGAYQMVNWCDPVLGGGGEPCNTSAFGACAGTGVCLRNLDWVMPACANDLPAIATPTLDFAWATAGQEDCNTDTGESKTLGGLILDVDAGAIGTYLIDIDNNVNNSFMTDGGGLQILGITFTPACITITTGSCCYEIGIGDGMCEDGHSTATCDALAGITGRVFRAGVSCADANCPKCTSPAECDDGDACTDDTCNLATFICSNTLNYDPNVDCCDPGSGGLDRIDDDEQCTTDSCDDSTGVVTNACNSGSCNDDNDCTVRDVCDGICDSGDPDENPAADRWCSGHDVNGDPCDFDGDCDVGLCIGGSGGSGVCECLLCTPLVINVSAGSAWDPNCFAVDETVNVQIALGPGGSVDLFGGQFLLNYDESCVELLSVASCPGSPFPAIIDWEAGGGMVWWASTTDPGNPQSTKGPDDIVCMEFRKLPGCDGCDMCFASINPRNTILTNTTGNPVAQCIENNCSKVFRERGVIDLVTPPDVEVNADCGLPTAIVNWDKPSATDSCDGELTVACVAAHDSGLEQLQKTAKELLESSGGEFPQGTSFFRCEATNSCHDTAVTVWTVRVSDQHGLHVEVELAGGMNPGMFWRAIDFQLYDNLCSDPTKHCEVLTFGGPFNFSRHARGWLKVDKGNYSCISAKDPLHTLRSCAVIECVDNDWSATFKGDAVLGGNGLVGGNLDCWKAGGNGNIIDVLDAGVYLGIIARNDDAELWHDPHTSCGQAGPDGDINADGHTDSADYSFILENFLRASKICCGCPGASVDVAITSITIKELRRRGFPELAAADINGDGVLDTEDMALYMEGHLPVIQVKSQKRLGSTR